MCNVQGCKKAPHQHHCLGNGMGVSAGPWPTALTLSLHPSSTTKWYGTSWHRSDQTAGPVLPLNRRASFRP